MQSKGSFRRSDGRSVVASRAGRRDVVSMLHFLRPVERENRICADIDGPRIVYAL